MTSILKQDALTGMVVVLAPRRAGRPSNGNGRQGVCAFCQGHESETPPEVDAIRPSATEPNTEGWTARAIPNLYPAFEPLRRA